MPRHSLSSDRILEIIEKLKVKHYENTIFNKVELFISRICHDDKNRLHLLNNKTKWLDIFNEFKDKLNDNGFNFKQIQGGSGAKKRKAMDPINSIKEDLEYILEKTTLFHDNDMNKEVNINKEEYLDTLENYKVITEIEKKYFLENSDDDYLSRNTKINEDKEEYINKLVEIYYYKHKIISKSKRKPKIPITVWNKDYVNDNCFPSLRHFLGYIFHLGDKDNYWYPWNLDIESLNQKVNIDFNSDLNQGLKEFNFIREKRDEVIEFGYVVNYLVIMLCLYNIYYNTRICVHYRNEKSKINNNDVITQGWLPTFNYETTLHDFLAKISYNTRFDDKSSGCTSKKVEINNGHVELKDYYLKQQIYLGNQYNKVYENLITENFPDVSIFNLKFNNDKPTLTTYNLQEKNRADNNFEKLIDNFINKMYLGSGSENIQRKAAIKNSINNSPVNLYQEVNRNFLKKFVENENIKKINITLDSDLKTKGDLCNFFMNNNNIEKNRDNGNYTIPRYMYGTKFCVYTTNRLSSFDEDNLNKCNLICSNQEINDIFIGKLLDSCIAQWVHTFIAIKNNNNIYINIHLDTDKNKYIPQTELMYLLKHVIPKYDFFKISDNQKIYIAGDFNLDCVDIISTINLKVNHIFYKDKIFKVALNNIITHTKGNSLDNCIIIEYRTKHSSSSTPIVGSVPEPVEYNPDIFVSKYDNSDELPDHGLVILKDSEINSSLNEDCSAIFEDIYINKQDVMRTSGGSKKNVGKKNVGKKNVGDLKKNVSKKNIGDLNKNVNKKNIDNSKKK